MLADVRLTDRSGTTITRVRLFKSETKSYIWSWDRYPAIDTGADPEDADLERADSVVASSKTVMAQVLPGLSSERRDPKDVAQEAWDSRPQDNGRLMKASTRAWREAAAHDPDIELTLYDDVD